MNGVSVIICCYNSEKVIESTLLHLSKVIINGFNVEIILVDNNCTDNTVEVARKYWSNLNSSTSLKIVEESTPGLNAARKRGVDMSEYPYIIFCDDDNRFEPTYVSEVYKYFESNLKLGVLGGWSVGIFEVPPPAWFEQVQTAYAVGGEPKTEEEDVLAVWGSGMAIRKELGILIFTRKFRTTDRTKDILTAGGDSEICTYASEYGYEIKKSKKLKFYHFIKKERLEWSYCIRLFEGFGYSNLHYLAQKMTLRIKLSVIKSIILFFIKKPTLIISILQRKEGAIETLAFFSLLGTLKCAFASSLSVN